MLGARHFEQGLFLAFLARAADLQRIDLQSFFDKGEGIVANGFAFPRRHWVSNPQGKKATNLWPQIVPQR